MLIPKVINVYAKRRFIFLIVAHALMRTNKKIIQQFNQYKLDPQDTMFLFFVLIATAHACTCNLPPGTYYAVDDANALACEPSRYVECPKGSYCPGGLRCAHDRGHGQREGEGKPTHGPKYRNVRSSVQPGGSGS